MKAVFNPFTGALDLIAGNALAGVQALTGNGPLTINFALGRSVSLSLQGNTQISVINWPSAAYEGSLVLNITNTGAFTITAWPSGSRAGNGVSPTIAAGAGAKTSIVLRTNDGGATVFVDQIAYAYQAI